MLNLTFKEKYELLKEQRNNREIIIKPIYPKALGGRIDRLYTKLYNYYKSVIDKYDMEKDGFIYYYYMKFLYTITLYFYGVIFLFCEYDLEEKT